jgi:hypothetical protein
MFLMRQEGDANARRRRVGNQSLAEVVEQFRQPGSRMSTDSDRMEATASIQHLLW